MLSRQSAAGTVYAVVDNQSKRPGERDEETPSGELTPRRLKALTPAQIHETGAQIICVGGRAGRD